jgi:hypothetical protein
MLDRMRFVFKGLIVIYQSLRLQAGLHMYLKNRQIVSAVLMATLQAEVH